MPNPKTGSGRSVAGYETPLHRLNQPQQDREIAARTKGDNHRATAEAVWDFFADHKADEEDESRTRFLEPINEPEVLSRSLRNSRQVGTEFDPNEWDPAQGGGHRGQVKLRSGREIAIEAQSDAFPPTNQFRIRVR